MDPASPFAAHARADARRERARRIDFQRKKLDAFDARIGGERTDPLARFDDRAAPADAGDLAAANARRALLARDPPSALESRPRPRERGLWDAVTGKLGANDEPIASSAQPAPWDASDRWPTTRTPTAPRFVSVGGDGYDDPRELRAALLKSGGRSGWVGCGVIGRETRAAARAAAARRGGAGAGDGDEANEANEANDENDDPEPRRGSGTRGGNVFSRFASTTSAASSDEDVEAETPDAAAPAAELKKPAPFDRASARPWKHASMEETKEERAARRKGVRRATPAEIEAAVVAATTKPRTSFAARRDGPAGGAQLCGAQLCGDGGWGAAEHRAGAGAEGLVAEKQRGKASGWMDVVAARERRDAALAAGGGDDEDRAYERA